MTSLHFSCHSLIYFIQEMEIKFGMEIKISQMKENYVPSAKNIKPFEFRFFL